MKLLFLAFKDIFNIDQNVFIVFIKMSSKYNNIKAPLEEWKEIDGFTNYEISTLGRCRNKSTGKILKERNITGGYIGYYLTDGNLFRNKKAHRLVACAFIKNELDKKTVNHIDGKKHNNILSNLEWATYSENNNHAIKNGLVDIEKTKQRCSKLGERTASENNRYKILFTQKEVRLIREDMNKLKKQHIIKKYELSDTTYYRIKNHTYTIREKAFK